VDPSSNREGATVSARRIGALEALVRNIVGAGSTRVTYEARRIKIYGGSGVTFSGTAYIAGNKTTGLDSDSAKPWVRCFLDTATAEENAGPPPNPFPMNEEWYEKAQTAGDIHIPRA
jgi:hypothetical protein